jgi:type VI secretion system protein ImpL
VIKKLISSMYMALFLSGFGGISWFATSYYEVSSKFGYALFIFCVVILLTFKFLRRIFTLAKVKLTLALNPEVPIDGEEEPRLNLRRQWHNALRDLKHSKLSKKGDPTYVFPWYLVIGAKNSGKTTALTRARLSSPVKDVDQNHLIEPTQTWNWWLYDTSIMIDIGSRYCTPTNEDDVAKEWREILSLLEKSRRKEVLNGIIVTVSASSLATNSRDDLIEEGRHLRRRIDELMRLFDSRIPVYVLITKCDQIYGFCDWAKALPADGYRQAFGYTNASSQVGNSTDLLDKAFDDIVDRTEDLRLVISRKLGLDEAILTFPIELSKLKPALKNFFEGAFKDTPYLESPLIRGIYLSSAEQDEADFPDYFGEVGEKEKTSNKIEGLFLKDLLGRLIPQDRYLVSPLGMLRRWYLATRNIGVAAWIIFIIGSGLFLSLNFARQIDAVAMMKEHRPTNAVLEGAFSTDIQTLLQYRGMIDWMQANAPEPVFKSIPMNRHIYEFRKNLKHKFFTRFHEFVIVPLDRNIAQTARTLVNNNASTHRSGYIQFLVRRINILDAFRTGKSVAELKKMPLLIQNEELLATLSGDKDALQLPTGSAIKFSQAYVDYLIWSGPENRQLLLESANTQAALLTQMAVYSEDLFWLADWAETQPGVNSIDLTHFWDGSLPLNKSAPIIEAGMTREGSKAIVKFIEELRSSTPATPDMLAKYDAFINWYRSARLNAWSVFLSEFNRGQDLLNGRSEWDRTLAVLNTDQDPYIKVISKIVEDFDEVKDRIIKENPPAWLQFARDFSSIRDTAKRSDDFLGRTLSTVKILKESSKEIVQEVTVSKSLSGGSKVIADRLAAAKAYRKYLQITNQVINEENNGLIQASQVARNFFGYGSDSKIEKSLVADALEAYEGFKKLINTSEAVEEIWPVIKGPLDYAIRYANAQAACSIQDAWESKVLQPIHDAADNTRLGRLIYAKDGVLWAFANNDAGVFIDRDETLSYVIVEKSGYSAPVSLLLPTVLNNGMKVFRSRDDDREATERRIKANSASLKKQIADVKSDISNNKEIIKESAAKLAALSNKTYTFNLATQPVAANADAAHIPLKVLTELQCDESTQTLENLNFPNNKTFKWSQSACGEVSLKIYFPDYTVQKTYEGANGFNDFITAFKGGVEVYTNDDFPTQKSSLIKDKVTEISVRYVFAGLESYRKDAAAKQVDMQNKKMASEALQKATMQLVSLNKALTASNLEQDRFEKNKTHLQMQDNVLDENQKKIMLPSNISSCWPDDESENISNYKNGKNGSSAEKAKIGGEQAEVDG